MRNDYSSGSENGNKRKCPEPCRSPTYLGWMEGGRQQKEPGPGQALIELATGQVRNFWNRQESLRVKGSPGLALPFLFHGGQSGEGARRLQPSVLSEEKKNQIGHPLYPPATPFPPHPHTFWRGQKCGSSRISLCAFRMGMPGGARISRAGVRSCSPRLGLPGEQCRNWWCLSTWGHSLGKGAESLSSRPFRFQDPASLTEVVTHPQCHPSPDPSSSSLAGQLLQGLGNPQEEGES